MTGNIVRKLVEVCGRRTTTCIFPARTLPLYSMITSCGVSRQTAPSYDWHGLRRGSSEFVLLQYTFAGRGMISYEGRSREVHPGEAMLFAFPHDNRYWLPSGWTWEFFFICLAGRDVVRLWRDLIARRGPVVALADDGPALRQAADLVEGVLAKRIATPFAASAQAYALAMALFDELAPARGTGAVPAFVAKVVAFCREHLAEPIGVEEMARAAGLSRYHFTRRFHAARGIAPGKFLVGLRLQEAVRLLQGTPSPVKEVAAACGFADPNYFCKVFRRQFGAAPAAFRKSGMY